VEAMVAAFGCAPRELRAALGPCIGACCFEVGPEVVEAFERALPRARESAVILASPGSPARIDLRRFSTLGLLAAGLLPEHVDAGTACTLCDPARRFFSYRSAGRATGQAAGFILRA
jgi:copper oxidase (laccase) domain-containing protein